MKSWFVKAGLFFRHYVRGAFKHLEFWVSVPGILCSFAGDPFVAQATAKWILSDPLPAEGETFNSEEFGRRKINLRQYIDFIASKTNRSELLVMRCTVQFQPALTSN